MFGRRKTPEQTGWWWIETSRDGEDAKGTRTAEFSGDAQAAGQNVKKRSVP
jgi:hypothetical protein